MRYLKKQILICLILLVIIAIPANLVNAQEWELIDELENEEIWRFQEFNERLETYSPFYHTTLISNEVSLGGNILISYFTNTAALEEYYSDIIKADVDKLLYPFDYLKMIYTGFDSEGNINIKIYFSDVNENRREEFFEIVNMWEGSWQLETNSEAPFMSPPSIEEMFQKSKDYNVDSSKIIKFDNHGIPPLKIETNKNDSNIKVKMAE